MNGLRTIIIQRNGWTWLKTIIVLGVLTIVLCGCSSYYMVGDGRGDWTVDLIGGYAIDKINSREILLVRIDKADKANRTIVLSNYYVDAYQIHEDTIFIKGIPTNGMIATDEELHSPIYAYYFINVTNHDISGPYDSFEALQQECPGQELGAEDWIEPSAMISTSSRPSTAAGNRRGGATREDSANGGARNRTVTGPKGMRRGLVPIGWDGYSVQLHHWEGIANNFYHYSPVSRTMHILLHMLE